MKNKKGVYSLGHEPNFTQIISSLSSPPLGHVNMVTMHGVTYVVNGEGKMFAFDIANGSWSEYTETKSKKDILLQELESLLP